MHQNRILLIVAVFAMFVAACGADSSSETTLASAGSTTTTAAQTASSSTTATTIALETVPADYAGYLRQPTACGADQPEPATHMQFDEPGDAGLGGPTIVTLHTSCGPITIEMNADIAPETANSFVFLAESGYLDGTVSHRIIPGFMMQAGDPTATGRGGPGYTIPDEFPTGEAPYTRGVVAMANAGPGTTGSQFFIMFDTVDWLGPQYTIVGEVTSGLESLDLIAQIPLGRSASSADPSPSTPLESLYIESVTVER